MNLASERNNPFVLETFLRHSAKKGLKCLLSLNFRFKMKEIYGVY
ncbi:hypothetical protein GYO_2629 [Bacillus spizizenii TU-B-10]|uniref:Uncharacterized protein n=1 Tax=Bacillus spizizenii (strain DSM 15029 / JCM 12233 / NBRC 101239 / NRRL B-23049 / TU-B-10) TaxID=1052585 RepID=G4NX54_BACS4|nr:hypothetical protein GYO_2629 [Bacillus spizizenii TU-B-10]